MDGYKCIAMDYTAEALELVKNKIGQQDNITLIQNQGFEVPCSENSIDAVIADGSLFYNSKKENEIILSNIRRCLKKEGLFWADWRSKKDSMFGKGTFKGDGLWELNSETGREGCCYYFGDINDIQDMYNKAGLLIESIDTFEYTERNGLICCSYFHVIAKK